MVINMKVAGIIVEYNPLHNGHIHHIEETRRLSKCDVLIAVMSGNFMQRGEPALIDKFTRTKMALENNIDLVIELPFVFSVQNADNFALSSVSILDKMGVDEIYFGSESDNIDPLIKIADILESKEYSLLLKKYINDGNSFPTSYDLAIKDLSNTNEHSKPNNILGVQYIKAIRKINSKINIKAIKRINKDYYSEFDAEGEIQSASALRKALFNGEDISKFVPKSIVTLLEQRRLISLDDFSEQFKYILSSTTKEELAQYFGVNEGIENRVLKVKNLSSTTDLINQLLTRRYTNSRIRRMLIHILCHTKKTSLPSFDIPYIRLLGMNNIGKDYLNVVKKNENINIISKVKEGIHPYLDIELRASKVYSLVSDKDIFKEEFKPLIYKRFN